jgi:phosphotriesterase-related protein
LRTGAPITVHTFEPFHPETRQGLDVLDIVEGEGVSLAKVYLSHMDALRNRKGPFGLDVEFLSEVAERGAYISLDGFGTWEWPVGALCYNLVYPTDFERAVAVRELIDAGFGDRILVSHDVCMKTNLRTYGGVGYDHLLVSMPRVFEKYGVGPEDLKRILVDNPRTLVS